MTRELLQQALDALEQIHPGNMTPMAEGNWNKAIATIRAELAKPENVLTDEEMLKVVASSQQFSGRICLTHDKTGEGELVMSDVGKDLFRAIAAAQKKGE